MIVIVRHGQAESAALSDRNRLLTEQGRTGVRLRAADLAARCPAFRITLVSPYLRTLQTLDILKEFLDIGTVQITDELVPNASADVADYMSCEDGLGGNVLVVSHMPLVSSLVSELCGPSVFGTFDPGDFYMLDRQDDDPEYKVIYSTNSFSLM
jgi:phosphohistidine phosphatase